MDIILKIFFIFLCMVAIKQSHRGIKKIEKGTYVSFLGVSAAWVFTNVNTELNQDLFDFDALLRAALTLLSFLICFSISPIKLALKSVVIRIFLMLSIWALLTSLWSSNLVLGSSKAILFVIWVLNFAYFAHFLGDKRIILNLFSKLPMILILQSLAYVVAYGINNYISELFRPGTIRLAIFAPAINANHVAFVLIVALLSLLYGESLKNRKILILTTIVMVLLTYSRIGILVLVLVIMIFLTRKMGAIFRVLVIALPIFILILINFTYFLTTIQVFALRNESQGSLYSLSGRLVIWEELFQNTTLSQLLLGRGYYSGFRFASESLTRRQQSSLDSSWVEVILTLGICGLIILLVLFLAITLSSRKNSFGIFREFNQLLLFVSISFSFLNSLYLSPTFITMVALLPFVDKKFSENNSLSSRLK